MTSLEVRLGPRSYPIHVGSGLLESLDDFVGKIFHKGRCAIITDSNVGPLYAKKITTALASFDPTVLTVPAGEKSKSLGCVEELCGQLIAAGFDRSSFVVALGGGVVGDLAGFAAAIYFRGIPCVQIPTTIIAQVDSAIGGKTGVNAVAGKNLIGAFHQPRTVIADVDTLRTLPAREFNEGFAEVIKHAIIRDAEMFDALAHFDRANLEALIARNAAIKATIVSADEHERTGERALLNFGHTVGHAIENAAGYGRFLHGEAIALGLMAATNLSVRHAGLPEESRDRILARLAQFELPTRLPPEIDTEKIMATLRVDKKFAAGQVRFVLTSGIGSAFVSDDVSLDQIRSAVNGLRSAT